MEELAKKPVSWAGDLDYEGFARAFGGDRSVHLDTATAWLFAAAKAAEGESYGVDLELRRYGDRGGFPCDREDLMLRVMLQEHYHCLSLAEICRTLGFDFAYSPPSRTTKLLMTVIGALPGKARWIPVMAAETIGTEVFRVLCARCEVFSATHPKWPPVCEPWLTRSGSTSSFTSRSTGRSSVPWPSVWREPSCP